MPVITVKIRKGEICGLIRRPVIDDFRNRCISPSYLLELIGKEVEVNILPCLEQNTCCHNQHPLSRGDP